MKKQDDIKTVDVLVVGAGGYGLTLSIFLAGHGVDFLTVERKEGTQICRRRII